MRLVAGLIAGAFLFSAPPASAQVVPPRWNPRAPENAQLLPAFSTGTVAPVLDAIGAKYQRAGEGASPRMLVTFPNNRKAALVFGACNSDGSACKALSVQSYWTRIANAAPERTARAVEAFNQRYSFSKAFVAADGRPTLQRYLTADYGFVRGNLAVNLLVFANQAERFGNEVLRPLESGGK